MVLGLLYTDFNGENISESDQIMAERIARQVVDGVITNSNDALLVNLLRSVIGTNEVVAQP
ncbi:MAG: hypothetical protein R2753_10650 [Chitinophagales bacterium]